MPGIPGGVQAAASLIPGQQQAANTVLTDDYANPTANEGNLLSLITLNQILGKKPTAAEMKGPQGTFYKMAQEETKYLTMAMQILTDEMKDAEPERNAAIAKLKEKFGTDMAAAVRLGNVLKTRTNDKEEEMWLNPFTMDMLRAKHTKSSKTRGGFGLAPSKGVKTTTSAPASWGFGPQ